MSATTGEATVRLVKYLKACQRDFRHDELFHRVLRHADPSFTFGSLLDQIEMGDLERVLTNTIPIRPNPGESV